MSIKHLYLGLCLVGAIAPLSQFLPWFMVHGLDLELFFSELFSTRISAFFGLDVIISAIVLIIFVLVDSKRLAVSNAWLAIVATLCVGVSLGLPLYLYMREQKIERSHS